MSSVKQPGSGARILAYLRRKIYNGKFPPGSRLPTRDKLAAKFESSKSTVQEALNRLVTDGLVVSRGSAGTFVANGAALRPRYGLVFERRPQPSQPWSGFWKRIQIEALTLCEERGCEFRNYYCSGGNRQGVDFLELMHDVQTHNVNGLIFAGPPFVLADTPPITQPSMPRVGIMAEAVFDVPSVFPDMRSFLNRAMDYIKSRGRKRVGMISMSITRSQEWDELVVKAAADRGLVAEPPLLQTCHFDVANAAARIVHLMMMLPKDRRPDALILADDNLVEYAGSGLIAAGVSVPDDVEVLAHCNYPLNVPDVLPFTRLGFDTREMLRKCLVLLEMQRGGETKQAPTRIAPLFEYELKDKAIDLNRPESSVFSYEG